MKHIFCTLGLSLLMGGMALAGPVAYEKIVVPEPVCGPWYISAYGGGSFYDDAEFAGNALAAGAFTTASLGRDNGWIAGGAVGLRTDTNWRFEFDVHHHQSPFDGSGVFTTPAGGSGPFTGVLGDVETTSAMFNVVKEFGMTRWRPYLGAGVGLSTVEVDGATFDGGAGPSLMLADDVVLGYQGMAGLVYDVTECLQAYLEYRITGNGDVEDAFSGSGAFGELDTDWAQHVIIGGRFFF